MNLEVGRGRNQVDYQRHGRIIVEWFLKSKVGDVAQAPMATCCEHGNETKRMIS
jgi:hypothetical protein